MQTLLAGEYIPLCYLERRHIISELSLWTLLDKRTFIALLLLIQRSGNGRVLPENTNFLPDQTSYPNELG